VSSNAYMQLSAILYRFRDIPWHKIMASKKNYTKLRKQHATHQRQDNIDNADQRSLSSIATSAIHISSSSSHHDNINQYRRCLS